jgi:hypothetical protein
VTRPEHQIFASGVCRRRCCGAVTRGAWRAQASTGRHVVGAGRGAGASTPSGYDARRQRADDPAFGTRQDASGAVAARADDRARWTEYRSAIGRMRAWGRARPARGHARAHGVLDAVGEQLAIFWRHTGLGEFRRAGIRRSIDVGARTARCGIRRACAQNPAATTGTQGNRHERRQPHASTVAPASEVA